MSDNAEYPSLVDGKLVREGRAWPVINPATENVIAEAIVVDSYMLDNSVEAAKRALEEWRSEQPAVRSALLMALADLVRDNSDELARLITLEQGKPLRDAKSETEFCVSLFEHYMQKELPANIFEKAGDTYVEQYFSPIGVVAGIVPWNFPLLSAVMKIAPAVLTGNSIVVKPAPTTPLATLRFGALVKDVVPSGLIQILADDGSLGPKIVTHPGVAMISFTGSTKSGKAVMGAAATSLKRLTLELGGNDPAVVFEDVNADEVATSIFSIAFMNCGQVCTAIKRLYIHESIHDSVCAKLAVLADEAVVGDGFTPGVTIGPVQNRTQFEKLHVYLEEARKLGQILAGGGVHKGKGYFVRPTIVAGLADDASLVTQEQFGPILPILRFSDENDVVLRANNSPYGLTASVWSSDLSRARRVARRLEAGTVWINKHLDLNPDYPMSPSKESGIGSEFGIDGLRQFTQPRLLNQ